MEFKFSCKLFEVSFSGDPGFVESQIQKYEPFILKVLEKLDKEMPPEPEKPPYRQAERQYEQRSEGRGRQPDRDSRYDKGGQKGKYGGKRNEYGYKRSQDRENRQAREKPAPKAPVPEEECEEMMHKTAGEEFMDAVYDSLSPSREEKAEKSSPPPEKLEAEVSKPQPVEFPKRRKAPSIRDEELRKVVDDKKPRTHHDRLMVFGYYMENQGGGTDFTIAEIKRCYRSINQDPGSNIEQVINHATRSGFVTSFDKGRTTRYKLSNKGRRYVEDGLKLA